MTRAFPVPPNKTLVTGRAVVHHACPHDPGNADAGTGNAPNAAHALSSR